MEVMCQMQWGGSGGGLKLSSELKPEDIQYLWKIWPCKWKCFVYLSRLITENMPSTLCRQFLRSRSLGFWFAVCSQVLPEATKSWSLYQRISEKATHTPAICDSTCLNLDSHSQRHSGEPFLQATKPRRKTHKHPPPLSPSPALCVLLGQGKVTTQDLASSSPSRCSPLYPWASATSDSDPAVHQSSAWGQHTSLTAPSFSPMQGPPWS